MYIQDVLVDYGIHKASEIHVISCLAVRTLCTAPLLLHLRIPLRLDLPLSAHHLRSHHNFLTTTATARTATVRAHPESHSLHYWINRLKYKLTLFSQRPAPNWPFPTYYLLHNRAMTFVVTLMFDLTCTFGLLEDTSVIFVSPAESSVNFLSVRIDNQSSSLSSRTLKMWSDR